MELTRNEYFLKYVSLAYAFIFPAAAAVFLIAPERLIGDINGVSRALVPSLPLAADTGTFWLTLTASMMCTITALSYLLYRDIRANIRMAIPLVIAKYVSSFVGLGYFLCGFLFPETSWNTFANLVIFISDFPLGTIVLVLYFRIRRG